MALGVADVVSCLCHRNVPRKVRTLALVEVLFAQIVSRNLFKQSFASREAVGIALIIMGVVLLLNG